MSMFVLYVLAFVSGAIILTYVLSLVHICHFDMICWIMSEQRGGGSIIPLIFFAIVEYCYLFLGGKNDYRCYNYSRVNCVSAYFF